MTPSSERSLLRWIPVVLAAALAACATVRLDRKALAPAVAYQRTAVYCAAQTAEGRRRAESIFRDALQLHQMAPARVSDAAEGAATPDDLTQRLKAEGFDSLLLVGRHSMVHEEPHEDWRSALGGPSTGTPLAVGSVVDTSSYRAALESPAARDPQNVARAQDLTVPGGKRYVSGHSWLVDVATGKAVWSAHGTVGVPEAEGSRKTLEAAAQSLVNALVEDGFLSKR